MKIEITGYRMTATVHWGSRHHFVISSYCSGELDMGKLTGSLKRDLVESARRYSYDWGDLNRPLYPSLGMVVVVPVCEGKVLHDVSLELEHFFKNEVDYTRVLIEENRKFKNGKYNMELAPANRKDE